MKDVLDTAVTFSIALVYEERQVPVLGMKKFISGMNN